MAAGKLTDEFAMIAEMLAPLTGGHAAALGLLDDAASLDVSASKDRLIVTTDTMVGGVHFADTAPPERVGEKLLRVNLSDIAAMAARPWVYNLSLALPGETELRWLDGLAQGLAAAQEQWGLSLVGGDTVYTPGPPILTVTMFGWADPDRLLTRAGARVGDLIYVSGSIGDAGLGLRIVQDKMTVADEADRKFLIDRHYLPTPRLEIAAAVAGSASAGLDISDGLVADLAHICTASGDGIGARVELDKVPVSPAMDRFLGAPGAELSRRHVLTAGEDYELLLCVPATAADAVEAAGAALAVPMTRIGIIESGSGVRVVDAKARLVDVGTGGYRHF